MRSIFAIVAFPLTLGASLAAAIALLGADRPLAALGVPVGLSALFVLVTERIFPLHRSWQRSHGDVSVDLAHVVSVSLTTTAMQGVTLLLAVPVAGALSGWLAVPLWPEAWPWLVQLPLALVVAEFPKYWLHRLMHEHDALWRLHATHHSAPRLYFLNASRFHPFDIGLDTLVGLFPLVALGCGAEVMTLFAVVSAVHGYFQHANLTLRLGPLNYFFSMAELHRWHHSKTVDEANHNYGQNVIVWDLLFGSFFWPQDREPPEQIGIARLTAFPTSFWRQLASPFRWRRIKRESGVAEPGEAARSLG